MESRIKAVTLTEAVLPRASLLQEILLIVGFSLGVALLARISVPFYPVPLTGQTLGVLLTGALLGSRRGALCLVAYLLEGAAGLPVFAAGKAGLPYMMGPTGGYLVGFVLAAFVVGWLAERGWDRRLWTAALAMLVGNVVLYIPGLLWLARFVPGVGVFAAGLLPFIPGDLLKLAIAAIVLPSGWAALQRWQR